MQEASYKVPNGKLLKVKLQAESGKISSIKLLGDFFLHPEETILSIENQLEGCELKTELIAEVVASVLNDSDATLIGATAEDFAKVIMMASK